MEEAKEWHCSDPIFKQLEELAEASKRYGNVSPCFNLNGRLHHIDMIDEHSGEHIIYGDPEKLLELLKNEQP